MSTSDTPEIAVTKSNPGFDEGLTAYHRRIVGSLRKIMQQMDTHSRRLIKEYDITVPQLVCLYEIYERGAVTLAVLSRRVHLSASTLVGVIDRLEEKKLVRRSRDVVDRRAVFIDITDEGRAFVQNSPHLLHNRLYESMQGLSESEQIVIANSLEMLVLMLESKNGGPAGNGV